MSCIRFVRFCLHRVSTVGIENQRAKHLSAFLFTSSASLSCKAASEGQSSLPSPSGPSSPFCPPSCGPFSCCARARSDRCSVSMARQAVTSLRLMFRDLSRLARRDLTSFTNNYHTSTHIEEDKLLLYSTSSLLCKRPLCSPLPQVHSDTSFDNRI